MTGCLHALLLDEPAVLWNYIEKAEEDRAVRIRVEALRLRLVWYLPVDGYTTGSGMTVLPHAVPWVVYEGPWTGTLANPRDDVAERLVLQFLLPDGRMLVEFALSDPTTRQPLRLPPHAQLAPLDPRDLVVRLGV